jgi:hypothetical protein
MGYFLFCKYDSIVLGVPSRDAQVFLLYQLDIIFSKLKGDSLIQLVHSLNIILSEWGTYFSVTKAQKVFALMDYLIFLKLRSWIFRRHPSWGRNKIQKKYFFQLHNNLTYKASSSAWLLHSKQIMLGNEKSLSLFKLRNSCLYSQI